MHSALLRSGVSACFVILVAACSGSSSSSSGSDGGTSGTSGTSGSSGTSGTSGGTSGSSGTSGTSGTSPAVARVIVSATLARGTSTDAECPDDGKVLAIGTFQPPAPVADGSSTNGGQVAVSCRVATSGTGFDANANVQLTGSSAGALLFNGSPSAAGTSSSGSISLTVQGLTYTSSSCVLTVDATSGQGIAAGRYWANVKCAAATEQATKHVCDIQAQIRVENCAPE